MTFQNIIAGGGGAKSISLIGGILALKEDNLLNDLKNSYNYLLEFQLNTTRQS